MHALTRPKYFMPVHGEYKHLCAHKEIACEMGMPADKIFVSDIGKVLEIDRKGARFNGPDVVSRGFVYVRENEELMESLRSIAQNALEKCLDSGKSDWTQMKNAVKDELSRTIYQKTKRRPMILPVIMNV